MGLFLREPGYNRNSKWIIYIFGIAVISAVIYAGNDSTRNKGTQTIEYNTTESEKTEKNTEIKTDDYVVTDGYSFETNNFEIIVNEVNTDFKDYDNEYELNTPKSGMKYVMVSFTFKNISSSNAYVGVDAFNCYADNKLCEQVYTLGDSDFFNVNLSPNREVTFETYYAVPVGSKSIELEYETNVLSDEKEIIKIQ
jgi:hypothetical protein